MKRGRPPLKANEVQTAKRAVHVAQMDFVKLEQCYQLVTGDVSKAFGMSQASYPVTQ